MTRPSDAEAADEHDDARDALRAALPHMGTGQTEAGGNDE